MPTKDRILSHLKKQKGSWVSGEALSSRLAVSRSAVWKHILTLKQEGYIIQSSPKKGYCFQSSSDLLLPAEIGEGLDTEIFGKKDIVYLSETDSTNIKAKDLAAKGAPEGTLVIAERQTQGRGRRGRDWFSPPQQGVYISLILRPPIPPSEAPKITLLTAVIVAKALLSLTQLPVTIKWPNDILVNGKKVAGILTEISTEMDAIDYVVVGMGMNVNTPEFPDEIREKATSLFIETGNPLPRVKLVREYLRSYEKYYGLFKETGFEPILGLWKELASIIGRQIIVEMIDKKYTGEVQDVDRDGVLILKDSEGTVHRIVSGDVVLT